MKTQVLDRVTSQNILIRQKNKNAKNTLLKDHPPIKIKTGASNFYLTSYQ